MKGFSYLNLTNVDIVNTMELIKFCSLTIPGSKQYHHLQGLSFALICILVSSMGSKGQNFSTGHMFELGAGVLTYQCTSCGPSALICYMTIN